VWSLGGFPDLLLLYPPITHLPFTEILRDLPIELIGVRVIHPLVDHDAHRHKLAVRSGRPLTNFGGIWPFDFRGLHPQPAKQQVRQLLLVVNGGIGNHCCVKT